MKKSELKEFIKSEIINELSAANENAAEEIKDTEELTKAVQDLAKAKEEAGLTENVGLINQILEIIEVNGLDAMDVMEAIGQQFGVAFEFGRLEEANIGLADLEEMGYEAGEEAFNMHFNLEILKNAPDMNSYRKGFVQAIIDNASGRMFEENLAEENPIQEMAKIAGDLKSAIEKVIQDNPELDRLPLKKAIKADADVIKALGDSSLYDNQLGKFIAAAKGEREIGKRGRKADPNAVRKPKSTTGRRGRPAKSKEEKDKESKTVASKLNKSVTTVKGDEPSAKDIKQAIGFAKQGKKDLQAQEKRKMVKAFVADMKKQGVISPNGKIEDKEKYDAAWAVTKPEIEAAVKNIK
jgi:hypothetical protein